MKNILMLAYTHYPCDTRIRREAETLVRHGNRVTMLALMEEDTPRTYELNGVTVVELRAGKYRGGNAASYMLSYLRFLLPAFLSCIGRFIRGEIDIVHVHNMPNFLVLAAIMPRLFGKKLILDIHDSVPETFEGKFNNPSPLLFKLFCLEERICCALAQRLICVNEVQRDTLVRRGIPADKITVILNVPDHHILDDRRSNRAGSHQKETFDLVYHGTIHRIQGLDLVIDAMPQLLERIPELHLHIIGIGPHLDSLVQQARSLGVADRVHFSMRVYPLNEILVMLESKDLGIVPNRRSTATDLMLPVKLLEYATIGLPTVVPNLKTIRHYFSRDMVTYFEPEDQVSMVEAITGLYINERKRSEQARRAREFMVRYGWERHQTDLVRIYDALH